MSDVNAAAERWRLANKAEEHKEYARSPYKGNFDLRLDDAYLLAEAYMAERHEDDAEPVTFDEAHKAAAEMKSCDCAVYGKDGCIEIWISQAAIKITTRGQLRRLIAAIG